MQELNFLQKLHTATKRDYLARAMDNKPECCEVARKFSQDYWDGDRRFGYGGMRYDGRYASVAKAMVDHYGLKRGDRVLDIGCGKGYLLHEFRLMGLYTHGIDISRYAIDNAKTEIKPLMQGSCTSLPFQDGAFDLVVSLNVFHNLGAANLKKAIQEMVRVSKDKSYICIESYRNEVERCNLLNWQLTALSLHGQEDWKWLLKEYEYRGDIEFIYFN